MYRNLLLGCCMLLAMLGTAVGQDGASSANTAGNPAAEATEVKTLSGMSVVGNDEAPKSLFIVPWKQSELGSVTSMQKMLSESAVPVDRDEFMRQLEFYELSTKKQ